MRIETRLFATGLGIFLFLSSLSAFAQKTDVITIDNGDRVTCEIKELKQGRVRIKTDYTETYLLEWLHVVSVQSDRTFMLLLTSGEWVSGALSPGSEDEKIIVNTDQGPVEYHRDQISTMVQFKDNWWKRWDGTVDLGASANKSNNRTQVNLEVRLNHKTERTYKLIHAMVDYSDRDDAKPISRQAFNGMYALQVKPEWYVLGLGRFEHNEELGLDHRVTLGAGVGRQVFTTPKSDFFLMGGVLGLNEKYVSEASGHDATELFFCAKYALYVFGNHETSLNLDIDLMPSLTDKGRLRGQGDLSLRYKLFKDFHVGVSLWSTYDSRPRVKGFEKWDWGLVTSLGLVLA